MKKKLFKSVTLEKIECQELVWGAVLIAISFLMPLFFTVQSFGIIEHMRIAMVEYSTVDLMFAAVKLVSLNALRAFPHYLGAFFVANSVELSWNNKKLWQCTSLFILCIIPMVYKGIYLIYDIRYDYGVPAAILSLCVVLFRLRDFRYIDVSKKILMLTIVTVAVQFLDIMPLYSHLHVGRGETSWNIKLIAKLLEAEGILNVLGAMGILLFVMFGIVVFFQLREENSLKQLAEEREYTQVIENRVRLYEIKNRTYQEVQYLVHDLKSPLTSIQTLLGVMRMRSEMEGRTKDIAYIERMENSVDQMSRMISELLYEDQRTPTTTKTLLDVALAQCSVTDYAEFIHSENQCPNTCISANRILFPRALVNLIQNSSEAKSPDRPLEIWVRVKPAHLADTKAVQFIIEDNGIGIEDTIKNSIWTKGISGHDSSGLGLHFVQSVVEGMDGYIHTDSIKGHGTRISITIPEDEKNEERTGNTDH